MKKLLTIIALLTMSLNAFSIGTKSTALEVERLTKLYTENKVNKAELVVLLKSQVDLLAITNMSTGSNESVEELDRWIELLDTDKITTKEFILLNKSIIDLHNTANFSHGVER